VGKQERSDLRDDSQKASDLRNGNKDLEKNIYAKLSIDFKVLEGSVQSGSGSSISSESGSGSKVLMTKN
jgi:hypothetical protein